MPKHDYTHADLYAMAKRGQIGWTGDECVCGATANVPSNGAPWTCQCGAINAVGLGKIAPPHADPVLGPSRDAIMAARREVQGDAAYPEHDSSHDPLLDFYLDTMGA